LLKVIIAGQKRGITKKEQRMLSRCNSVEPIIGHLKSDGKMRRSFLKGVEGDAMNLFWRWIFTLSYLNYLIIFWEFHENIRYWRCRFYWLRGC
jgi:hypothetical protein